MPRVHQVVTGQFLQHCPRVAMIVTTHFQGEDNAMAVAWHSTISINPPLIGVAIAPGRFTSGQILGSKEFGVNFVSGDKVELVAAVGGTTGSQTDKFERFKIAKDPPLKTSVPVLRDAYAAYECKLVSHQTYGDHIWFVGEIAAAHYDEEAFLAQGRDDLEKANPLVYLGADFYVDLAKANTTLRQVDRRKYGKG